MDTIDKTFKQNVIKALRGDGYQVGLSKFRPSFFEKLELKTSTVFDIGVCKGTPSLYNGFSGSKIVLIDPLIEVKSVAEKHGYDFINCACGSSSDSAEFDVPKGRPALTSLLERTELTKPDVESETRITQVQTLDNIVQQHEFQPSFGIKIACRVCNC